MSLFHRKLQRIVNGIGRLTLTAGEIFRPWLQVGKIEGVGSGSNLKNDRVELEGRSPIKKLNQGGLLVIGRKFASWGPVDMIDGSDPNRSKLPWYLRSPVLDRVAAYSS